MLRTQKKKPAGTVRQTGSVPAELPRNPVKRDGPRGVWRTGGRLPRHQGKRGGSSFGSLTTYRNRLRQAFIGHTINPAAACRAHHMLPVPRRHRATPTHSLRALVGGANVPSEFAETWPKIDEVRVCHDGNGYNKHHILVNRFRCDLHLFISVCFAP